MARDYPTSVCDVRAFFGVIRATMTRILRAASWPPCRWPEDVLLRSVVRSCPMRIVAGLVALSLIAAGAAAAEQGTKAGRAVPGRPSVTALRVGAAPPLDGGVVAAPACEGALPPPGVGQGPADER